MSGPVPGVLAPLGNLPLLGGGPQPMRLITVPRSGVSVTGLFPAIEPSPSPTSPQAAWPPGGGRVAADSSPIGQDSAASRQAVAVLVAIAVAALAAWASLGWVPRPTGRRRGARTG